MEKANISDSRLRKYTSRKVAGKMGVKEKSPGSCYLPKAGEISVAGK